MLPIYERIESLCKDKGINVTEMCKLAGVSRSVLSDYKTGRKQSISTQNIEKIADFFEVSMDYILCKTDKKEAPALTEKDERDISKKLQQTLDELENAQGGLMFDGRPLDDETKELLAISLKNSLELSKKIAKQKFTPKKYQK